MKILNKLICGSFLLSAFFNVNNILNAAEVMQNLETKAPTATTVTKKSHPVLEKKSSRYVTEEYSKSFLKGKGATFTIGGDMTVGISGNDAFRFNAADLNDHIISNSSQFAIQNYPNNLIFNQKKDSGYGVYGQLGYMVSPSMQVGLEAGYHKFKNTNTYNQNDKIESNIVHGMINFTQYFDSIGGKIKPYASVGAGLARICAEGKLNDHKSFISQGNIKIDNSLEISFKDLEKVTFAYQFGLGFETEMKKGTSFGLGYKYFATHAIESNDSDLKMDISYKSTILLNEDCHTPNIQSHTKTINKINFGKLKHQNHMINFFFKYTV